MKKKDIPAFPTAYKLNAISRGDGGGANYEYETYGGMSLRDYFAAKAMQGLMVGVEMPSVDYIADYAYRMADAMLAAKEEV